MDRRTTKIVRALRVLRWFTRRAPSSLDVAWAAWAASWGYAGAELAELALDHARGMWAPAEGC